MKVAGNASFNVSTIGMIVIGNVFVLAIVVETPFIALNSAATMGPENRRTATF